MMASELILDGKMSEDWVHSLSPSQLKAYYADMVRIRAQRQREDLHIQVSAAALIADGGKMAKSMDSALSDAAGQPTVRNEQRVSERPAAPLPSHEKTALDDLEAATAHYWS